MNRKRKTILSVVVLVVFFHYCRANTKIDTDEKEIILLEFDETVFLFFFFLSSFFGSFFCRDNELISALKKRLVIK